MIGGEGMNLGIGDTCYLIGDDNKVHTGRISAIKNETYFVQQVGICGALQLEQQDIFQTEEEAEASRKKETVHVSNSFR